MNITLDPYIAKRMFPIPPKDEHLECPYCQKHPSEILEYVDSAARLNMSAVDYVKYEEGTYCQYTGYFVCTSCYIQIGLPARRKLHSMFPKFRIKGNSLPGQDNIVIVDYLLEEL